MKKFRRGLVTLLCISMTGSMFPVPVSAGRTVSNPDIAVESAGQQNPGTEEATGGEPALYDAQPGVKYLAYNVASKTMEEKNCDSAEAVTSEVTSWGTAGQESWYVANGDITMENQVTVKGTVHLILADNCNLKMKKINMWAAFPYLTQHLIYISMHNQMEVRRENWFVNILRTRLPGIRLLGEQEM